LTCHCFLEGEEEEEEEDKRGVATSTKDIKKRVWTVWSFPRWWQEWMWTMDQQEFTEKGTQGQ
jgi:hypothetical protein